MAKICAKCGYELQENDFLCPNCGAIYGEPVYVAPPKPATVAAQKKSSAAEPGKPKKNGKWWRIVIPAALLLVFVCVLLWDPFSRPHSQSNPTEDPLVPTTTTMPPTRTTRPPTTSLIFPIFTLPDPAPEPVVTDTDILINYNMQFHDDMLDIAELSVEHYDEYSGVHVIFILGLTCFAQKPSMEEYYGKIFYYDTEQKLICYQDGQFFDLDYANRYNLLDLDSYEAIYKQYVSRNTVLYIPPAPTLEKPTAEDTVLQMLRGAYYDTHLMAPDSRPEDIEVDLYAVFDDVYVAIFDDPYAGSIEMDVSQKIGNVIFFYSSPPFLTVFYDGIFINLEDAYESGLLSDEEIWSLFELYRQQNWQLYYPDADPPINWNDMDWKDFDPSILNSEDRWLSWSNWMKNDASLENLVEMAYARLDGASSTSYALCLGERFIKEPVELIAVLAQAEADIQDRIAQIIVFSDAFLGQGLSVFDFLQSIVLPADATDAQRQMLQLIIVYANQYDSQTVPAVG